MTAIAAEGAHSMARKSDGTVVVWGCLGTADGLYRDHGQCRVPSDLKRVSAIAAGSSQTLALVPTPPAIDSLEPARGPVGTKVTIIGSDFDGATRVTFNGVSAGVPLANTGTELTVKVPRRATSGPVAITTQNGTRVGRTRFTVQPPAPKAGRLALSPWPARAGKLLSLTLPVLAGGKRVAAARAACTATLAGGRLPLVAHSFRRGSVRCAWRIPKAAGGKRLAGSAAATTPTGTTTRRFAAPVRRTSG